MDGAVGDNAMPGINEEGGWISNENSTLFDFFSSLVVFYFVGGIPKDREFIFSMDGGWDVFACCHGKANKRKTKINSIYARVDGLTMVSKTHG